MDFNSKILSAIDTVTAAYDRHSKDPFAAQLIRNVVKETHYAGPALKARGVFAGAAVINTLELACALALAILSKTACGLSSGRSDRLNRFAQVSDNHVLTIVGLGLAILGAIIHPDPAKLIPVPPVVCQESPEPSAPEMEKPPRPSLRERANAVLSSINLIIAEKTAHVINQFLLLRPYAERTVKNTGDAIKDSYASLKTRVASAYCALTIRIEQTAQACVISLAK